MIELDQADTFELSVADSEIAIGLIKESELKDQINEILSGITEEERIQMMEEAIKTNHQLNNSGGWDIKKGHKLNGV